MGDIADWIINGGCCQICGEAFYDEEECGYPRSCSACEDEEKGGREKPAKDKPFVVTSKRAFGALPRWLKERGINTFSMGNPPFIQVGYNNKPDSDWGKYENRGFIIVKDMSLYDETLEKIQLALWGKISHHYTKQNKESQNV